MKTKVMALRAAAGETIMFTGVSSSFRARKRFRAKTMGLALSDGAVVPPEAIGIRQMIRKTKENRHRQL